jgi:hypothetical protein
VTSRRGNVPREHRNPGAFTLPLVLLGLIGMFGGDASADEPADRPAPFLVRDMNPFILVHGLPPFDPAVPAPPHRFQLQAVFDLANNAKVSTGANESITLDGETYRLALLARYGVSERVEVGVEVPLVSHRSGVFDPFILSWHDLLGLSNGDRDTLPDNALDYSYRDQGQEQVAIRSTRGGLGDVRLFAAAAIYRADGGEREVSLRGSLKLPTGDSARLLGSGGTDLALSVDAVERGLGAWGDVLASRLRRGLVFGGLGLAWRAGSVVDLKAQLDGHGAVYQSELPQLDSTSVLLTVGGTVRFGPAASLDLSIGENLFVDTIPDVVLNLTFSWRF